MYFFNEDDDLLENCKTTGDEFSSDIKKSIWKQDCYNKKYLKTKIK